ncbi:Hypothetical Protein PANA_1868 [Pantoea ananatis LMG 20103]|jgi:uncharacterized membrane protein|uniref:Uncharacterized protein n=2 Tax=Pantoea ananas TaxID=553 RepID=D4GEC8_PANAM|nr:Hypothetical Protein PANA_1868 [Pantoea ananatis LMG 20103]PKC33991.1 hypothetical protein V462_14590 [Pantoea ananatis 15320]PKC40498.1 hypothetical protein V461_19500 [Pantoea ananatis BRT98]CRH33787.1 Uncharacterized protein BN1183_AX_00340 [Pantoea ananatis]CRH38302.1 Uncharacterized protein {ECO:0000313/EMBL:ADD77035.1} [Pantoea ananatis]
MEKNMRNTSGRSAVAVTLYALLEPVPLGFFVAAWLFDIIYMKTFIILWSISASWLIAIGLVIAILPRIISLIYMFRGSTAPEKTHFWLSLVAIILAIANAFIHSRDAYAVVPTAAILSTLVVILLLLANVQLALRQRTA